MNTTSTYTHAEIRDAISNLTNLTRSGADRVYVAAQRDGLWATTKMLGVRGVIRKGSAKRLIARLVMSGQNRQFRLVEGWEDKVEELVRLKKQRRAEREEAKRRAEAEEAQRKLHATLTVTHVYRIEPVTEQERHAFNVASHLRVALYDSEGLHEGWFEDAEKAAAYLRDKDVFGEPDTITTIA